MRFLLQLQVLPSVLHVHTMDNACSSHTLSSQHTNAICLISLLISSSENNSPSAEFSAIFDDRFPPEDTSVYIHVCMAHKNVVKGFTTCISMCSRRQQQCLSGTTGRW